MHINGNKEYQINKWKKIFLNNIRKHNPNDNKKCIYCSEIKKKKDFYCGIFKTKSGHDSLIIRKKCKDCCREYERNKKKLIMNEKQVKRRESYKNKWKYNGIKCVYGITKEEYERLLNKNNGRCHICNEKKKPYLDHCHKNNNIRGILCMNCNTALGHFKDNISILKNAIEYLNRYGNGTVKKP